MRSLFLLIVSLFVFSPVVAQVTGLSGWNIYLDPGHSQRENMGVHNYSEAEKNLRVALALRDFLLENTDIDTVYTSRTSDLESVSLSQRSDQANSLGAAWYHSIHSDAGAPSANRTLMLWGQYQNGTEKIPSGGQAMSAYMIDLLTRGMRIGTSGSWGDCSFYGTCSIGGGPYLSVNRRTSMPSELSEAGFHTSPVQNTRNMNADWKIMEAKTFYWSILEFWGIERPVERTLTGFVLDIETNKPLNGAEITVGDRTYTTDTYESLFKFYSSDPDQLSNGFYYLEDIGEGPLTIKVTAEGYKPFEEVVAVEDTFFTFFDVQLIQEAPPQVTQSKPAQDEVNYRFLDNIDISFSRKMDRTSTEAAFTITPAAAGVYIWGNDDFKLTFNPDNLEPLTDYTVTIAGSATGIFGDALDGNSDGNGGDDFTLRFRTSNPDVEAPRLIRTEPRPNARDVIVTPVVSAIFDEHLDPLSVQEGMVTLKSTSGNENVPGTVAQYDVGDQSILTFFPSTPLMGGISYRLTIAEGITDVVGNATTSSKSFNFTTETTLNTFSEVDDFEVDLEKNWWEPQQSGSTSGIVTDSTGRNANNEVTNLTTGSLTSMRIRYGWDENASDWLVRQYLGGGAPRSVLFDTTYALEAYVFGDGSGNLIRFAVDDNVQRTSAGHEVSPWFEIDWIGWKRIRWHTGRDGTGTWIGNGVVEGTLRFDSIQLSHITGAPAFGTIFVDDLRLVRTATGTASDSFTDTPSHFKLYPNYPNPFNPRTTLRYDLPDAAEVTLHIYNTLGARVATLIDGATQTAGNHEIVWDATGFPSGIYFARMATPQGVQTSRMVLLK